MLIVFDCDGVLVDSEIVASRVELEQLKRYGCGISLPEYLRIALGRTEEEEIWNEIAAAWDVKLPADFVSQTWEKVAQAFDRELKTVDGVEEALEQLMWAPRCVASGSRLTRLKQTLRLTGLESYFADHVFSAEQIGRGKPHPDLFLFAAEEMDRRPEDCIVVEDSVPGVLGAVAAGMTVLGFTGAGHCLPSAARRLEEAGCSAVLNRMKDLPDFCRGFQKTRQTGPGAS
jgi:HAD superfamily hydrolase (TIGR01509 family)